MGQDTNVLGTSSREFESRRNGARKLVSGRVLGANSPVLRIEARFAGFRPRPPAGRPFRAAMIDGRDCSTREGPRPERGLRAFRFPRIEPRGVLGRRAVFQVRALTRLGGIRDNSAFGVGRGCLRSCASPNSWELRGTRGPPAARTVRILTNSATHGRNAQLRSRLSAPAIPTNA